MSIWKIKDMEVLKTHNGAENVIWKVNLEVRKAEGKKPFNLPANIDIGDVTGSDFVPFEDVTEDMVISWLKKTLNKIRPGNSEQTSFTEDIEQHLSDEDEIVTVVKTFS